MSKKHPQINEPSANLVKEMSSVKKYLSLGNNWLTRKNAHRLLKRTDISASNRAALVATLRMTWPDTLALFAGLGCLLFTVVVAFLVSY